MAAVSFPQITQDVSSWMDMMKQALWVVDSAGCVVFANRTSISWTGLQAFEMQGCSFVMTVHPEDRQKVQRLFQECVMQGVSSQSCVVVRLLNSRGQSLMVQLELASCPPMDEAVNAPHWLVTCTDVHETIQRLNSTCQQNQVLQDIIDASPNCIKVLDLEARIVTMNVGGLYALEIDDFQTCMGVALPSFWEGKVEQAVQEAITRALRGEVMSFEGLCPTMKGTPKWWEVTLSPLYDEQGEITNLLAIACDISERVKDRQEIREVKARLKEKDKTCQVLYKSIDDLQNINSDMEKFAYIAAHDLKEPIRTISGFSSLLIERYEDQLDEKAKKYLDVIDKGTLQMKALVEDLLIFSRVSHETPELKPVPAGRALKEAMSRLDAYLEERQVEVTFDQLPVVQGNLNGLTQVLQNLLSNAIKFTNPDCQPNIHISAQLEGEYWHFQVTDNGIGMNSDHLDCIFQMFQRLHTRDRFEGTGLGLAICRKVIETHGGNIWATSTPGQGSVFHFTLKA